MEFSFVSGDRRWLDISFDPGKSGGEFSIGGKTVSVPATTENSHRIRVFLDASVVECIVDDTIAVTTRNYSLPNSNLRIVTDKASSENLSSVKIWKLKPMSSDRLTSDSYL